MRSNWLILLFLTMCSMVCAQSEGKASALFEDGKYEEAKQIYEKLLRKSPKSVLYAYRYARCAQETGDHETAIKHFAKTGKRYVLTYFFLGESYMALWRTDEAIDAYNTYLEQASNNERFAYVTAQIRTAEMRQRYLKRVRDIEIYDSVVLPKQRLLEAYHLSAEAGMLEQDSDGCIKYTSQRGDMCVYSVMTGDNKKLVSSYRLLDKWSAADTLDNAVNAANIQNYPFCKSDGITIYFASDSKDGFGGLDIYMSRYNSSNNTYTKPENAGFPFNSEGNDYMLVTDETRHIGYFATDRFCQQDSVCVYRFRLTDEPQYITTDDNDSLALFAQLKVFRHAAADVQMVINESMTNNADSFQNDIPEQHEMHFVLNDSVVYVTEQDFVSKEAQKMYSEYMTQLADCESIEHELSSLRHEYRTANAEQKKRLVSSITDLEKEQKRLQLLSKQTLQQVRQLELSAIKATTKAVKEKTDV